MAGTEADQQRGQTIAFDPTKSLLNGLNRNAHQYRLDICLWSALKPFSIKKKKKKSGWRMFPMNRRIRGSIIWSSNGLVIRQSRFWQVKTLSWHLLSFHPVSDYLLQDCHRARKPGAAEPRSQTCQFHWIALPALRLMPLKCLLTKEVSYFPRIN